MRILICRKNVSNRTQTMTTQTLIPSTVQVKTSPLIMSENDDDDDENENEDAFGGEGWENEDLDF